MMISLLTLLLLSADPGSEPPSSAAEPLLVVAVTSAPGLEKTATEAGRTLGLQLSAPHVEWSGYLKARGKGCAEDVRCLLAAPGVAGASRLVHLRLRPLPSGRFAVDVRLVDVRTRKVLGRSASVREPGELSSWVEATATRLLTQAAPYAKTPPPSPFAAPPPSQAPSGGDPLRPPSAPAR
jgi:hypothetical protein